MAIPTTTQQPYSLLPVNSFDDLRSVSVRPDPNHIIYVLYRTAINDGYGGTFYFDPTSVEADNDDTIIAPATGQTGRWKKDSASGGSPAAQGLPGTLGINPNTLGHDIIMTEGDFIRGSEGNVRVHGDGYVSGDLTVGTPDLSHTALTGDFQVTETFSLVGRSLDLLSDNVLLDYQNNILTLGSAGISLDFLSDGTIDCGVNQFKNAVDPTDLQDLVTLNYLELFGNDFIHKDGSIPWTGDQSVGGFKLTSLANGTNPTDAINKSQLDGYNFTSLAIAGDVSGTLAATTVDKLKNVALSIPAHGAAQDGYVLTFVNGSSNIQLKPTSATTVVTLAGDVTGPSNSNVIANNVVDDNKIRTSTGLSVIGRSLNTTGNVADITGTNNQVLRISGSNLLFGAVDLGTAQVTASADVNINTHKLINVVDPSGAQDAATKAYVDVQVAAGKDFVFYFGNGADGTLTASSGTTTLTKDTYYQNVTLTSTAKINTNGYRLFVSGTLTITGGGAGAIFNDGTAGTSLAASGTGSGAGAPSNSISGGGRGGNVNAGTGTNLGNPGTNGGNGGDGGNDSTANVPDPAGTVSNSQILGGYYKHPITNTSGTSTGAGILIGLGGGAGGGGGRSAGGTAGGGGGGAGGLVWLAAYIINRGGSTAASCIRANGGNGGAANNNSGGGGGGGGGWIYLTYYTLSGSTGTNILAASGGNGGNSSGGSGGDGGDGGRITIINITTGGYSESTGSAGGANSGATGGTGNVFRVSL